ncbi:MAG: hypothetical protein NZT61_00805 [Deltaproteobacteria bacterium]|nr:hypothetical protein [Deltaproteobacteria bacterium]MCX7952881.1 hypothetical protein [Deltaproteobacteria bacterium]
MNKLQTLLLVFILLSRVFCQELPVEELRNLSLKYRELSNEALKDKEKDIDVGKKKEEIEKLSFVLITGLDLDEIKSISKGNIPEFETQISIREIFYPFIAELGKIAVRPRDIVLEENRLHILQTYVERLQSAKLKVSSAIAAENDPALKSLLTLTGEIIDDMFTLVSAQKAMSEAKLINLKTVKSNLGGVFARLRGSFLSFVEALFYSFVFYFVLKQFKNFLEEKFLQKPENHSLLKRITLILLVSVNFVGTLCIFLYVLYYREEWLLFGLASLVLIAGIILSKRLISDFFTQTAILLNLGFVREGEVITYNDLPYRIKSLGFVCLLENPDLETSCVRVPLTDLVDKRSYCGSQNFRPFNTRVDDYIFFENDTLPSKVIHQNIQFVKVERPDKTVLVVPTRDFIKTRIRKIEEKFVIFLRLGIAYKHIESIFSLADRLKQACEKALKEELALNDVDAADIVINAVFFDLSASSLDFGVSAACNASHAPFYGLIRRGLIKGFVLFTIENKLEIPFQSITVYEGKV